MIRRLRKFTLWTGTLLCLLIAAAFVVSAWWWVVVQVPTSRGPALYLVAGSLSVVADKMLSVPVLLEPSRLGLSRWNDWSGGLLGNPQLWVYFEWPLYAIFAAVAIPTLIAWRLWPKPVKPGHCRCGYDLTGNTSGVCPECGQPFEPKGDAA